MELFVFLDLDDTIFQTPRKCPAEVKLTPASVSKEGLAASFFTEKQYYLFNALKANTHIIPTTARDEKTFLRATCIEQFEYAIINHGGIVLNADGSFDRQWFQTIENQITPLLPLLKGLEQQVRQFSKIHSIPLNIRLIEDFGLSFYVSIKHEYGHTEALTYVDKCVIQPYLAMHALGFYCHINDNNLSVLPNEINKASAVAYVQKKLDKRYKKDYLSVGMGDSLTDMAYMQLCDYFITPKNSQILRNFE
ncbi:MAG: hypothetical protein KAG26_02520 [Methylococcales bacterium]|nr:hypothetical protein [Methylococcales bacterium]